MAQQVFKSPINQSESIENNPFNQWSVSQDPKKKSPSAFFGGSKRLVNMSPNDYFKLVASQGHISVDDLIKDRLNNANEMSIEEMRQKMRNGVKFDTPWIRLSDRGEKGDTSPYFQEGLHRMLAAGQEYGMDTKFPIYLAYQNDQWNEIDTLPMDDFIKHYDDTRLKRYNEHKKLEEQEQKELDDWYKQQTADYFNVLLENVTPEMLKEYTKYEDKMWEEDFD